MKTKDPEKIPLFGRKLIALRKKRHLTQAQLAREVGLSRQMISYFESRAENPTIDMVRKLTDFFNVSADEFLYESREEVVKPGPKSAFERKLEAVRKLPREKQKALTTVLDMALQQ